MTTALRERLNAIRRLDWARPILSSTCYDDIEYISYTPAKVFPAWGIVAARPPWRTCCRPFTTTRDHQL